jgi:hypothetical protein
MPTPETERQKTERLLHEQLARAQMAEAADYSLRGVLALDLPGKRLLGGWLRSLAPVARWGVPIHAFVSELFSRPSSGRRNEARIETAPPRLGRWRRGARKQDQLAELQSRIEALRSERALSELFAAAAAEPPGQAMKVRTPERPVGRTGGAPLQNIAGARRQNHGLPNVSVAGAKLAAMKKTPAHDWGSPPKVQFPRPDRKKDRRSDLVVAALGVTLGLICALFPWYIFFNQEQFGVQTIAFGGRGHNSGRIVVDPRPVGDATLAALQDMPKNLDLFTTGALQAKAEASDKAPGMDQQPFPAEAAEFRLVHVANGRAMIEDNAGLWVVQQGSTLPDSTSVKSIERRKGQWVLVTSADRVIEISR